MFAISCEICGGFTKDIEYRHQAGTADALRVLQECRKSFYFSQSEKQNQRIRPVDEARGVGSGI